MWYSGRHKKCIICISYDNRCITSRIEYTHKKQATGFYVIKVTTSETWKQSIGLYGLELLFTELTIVSTVKDRYLSLYSNWDSCTYKMR